MQRIDIAHEFSKWPGGRFRTDGKFSGELFREKHLLPLLKKEGERVEVIFDNNYGYGSSFLEEAFGGLVRKEGFDPSNLLNRLELKADDPFLVKTIQHYISSAGR